MPRDDRPTARSNDGAVLLTPPENWQVGEPVRMSADDARDLAGELLAAALEVKFGRSGLN
jgi:hypothetical protein